MKPLTSIGNTAPMNKPNIELKPILMDDCDMFKLAAQEISLLKSINAQMMAALEACAEAFKDTATKDGGALYQKASTAYEAALIAISRAKGGKA